MFLIKWIDYILDILFPPRCPFCHKLLKSDEVGFCCLCQENLPWIVGPDAEQKFSFVSLCVSPLWYQGDVRESIHCYKFGDCSGYSKVFGTLVAQSVHDHLKDRFDVITWVPLSSKGLKKRGYDQAKILAMSVAKNLNCSITETLHKTRNTATQSGITNDAARRANVLSAFEAINVDAIAGKRILLIDDVVTTGSTLSECACILRTAGAIDVVCATFARARREKT